MSLLDDEYLGYLSRWSKKKRLAIFLRSHLSHIFALVLAILVLIREIPEMGVVFHPSNIQLWHIFILGITGATIIAAYWEFRGNRLATTPQEIRFVLGIRSLLTQLEKFKREIIGKSFSDKFDNLSDFCSLLLKVTSNTICGKKEIAGGLMFYQNNKGILALHSYTPGSMYQHGLEIPLGKGIRKDQKGPATKAFETGQIAHMPNKSKKIGILLEAVQGERYRLAEMFKGWYDSQSAAEENFSAVLSIPVTIYANQGEKINYGILNYTSIKGDPFVPRDYIMAECFASILAQAIYAALFQVDNTEPDEAVTEPEQPPASVPVTSAKPSATKAQGQPPSRYPKPKRNKKRRRKK